MPKFRKRAIEVEAIQWTNDNTSAVLTFVGEHGYYGEIRGDFHIPHIAIQTLEGTLYASFGDWIIRGVQGELYPVKPDIFEATYEPVE